MTETTSPQGRIIDGLRALVTASGENSRDRGFHDDWPEPDERMEHMPTTREVERWQAQQRRAIAEKLALIHEEVSEALGEIRSGHAPGEVYYRDTKGMFGEFDATFDEQRYTEDGTPILKPEGFGVELADAMIRIADTSYLTGIDLPALVLEKARYNATRPYKHGRQF